MTPRLTREQAAIIGAYTGITCGPFADVHQKAEQLFGRPIWTHQFADKELMTELRALARPDFLAICAKEDAP
jgi:hypothetical protein